MFVCMHRPITSCPHPSDYTIMLNQPRLFIVQWKDESIPMCLALAQASLSKGISNGNNIGIILSPLIQRIARDFLSFQSIFPPSGFGPYQCGFPLTSVCATAHPRRPAPARHLWWLNFKGNPGNSALLAGKKKLRLRCLARIGNTWQVSIRMPHSEVNQRSRTWACTDISTSFIYEVGK